MALADRDFDNWWNYKDPAGTAERFRHRLEEEPADREYRLELLTQLARTQSLQRELAAAHEILNGVEKELAGGVSDPVVRIRYHLERGRAFRSAGAGDEAERHFRSAWEEALAAGADFYAVDAAHMLAIVAEPAEQIRWNEKALVYAEASTQPRARNWLGSLYNNLGWTYHDLGEYDKALTLFEQALAFHQERGNAERSRTAQWCVARCLRSLGRLDEALASQRELEGLHAASGEPDGYVFEELGELLLQRGEAAAAAPYFARAHELLSQEIWLKAEQPDRLARLQRLAAAHE